MKSNELFRGILEDKNLASEIEIDRVTDRIEEITHDTCFVFTKGVFHDKSSLLPLAIAKAPAVIITEEEIECDLPVIQVKDAREALARLVCRRIGCDLDGVRLIGVTGTNGKTTTASMLAQILSHNGSKVGLIGTGKVLCAKKNITPKDYTMTTPDPYLLYPILKRMKTEGCTDIVMEVSSHALALGKVAPLRFTLSIFTSFGEDHLDFHKSKEAYLATKLELFRQSDCAVINGDDEVSMRVRSASTDALTVGAVHPSDVTFFDVEDRGIDGARFLIRYGKALTRVAIHLGGAHNLMNAALAYTAACKLGVAPHVAAEGLAIVKRIDGRMERILDRPRVIVDYAHTPEAMNFVLKSLGSSLSSGQKLFCLFGCGGEREREKRSLMARAAETYADLTVVTEDNPRKESRLQIFRDILRGFEKETHLLISDRAEAIRYLIQLAGEEDIVVLLGKGHERYTIGPRGKVSFDERKIVRDAYEERKVGHTK